MMPHLTSREHLCQDILIDLDLDGWAFRLGHARLVRQVHAALWGEGLANA
jgi:hypothetical protein